MVALVTLSLFNRLKLFWSRGLCCFITNKFENFAIWNCLLIVMLIQDWPEESKETLPKEDDPLKTLSNSIQGNTEVMWLIELSCDQTILDLSSLLMMNIALQRKNMLILLFHVVLKMMLRSIWLFVIFR